MIAVRAGGDDPAADGVAEVRQGRAAAGLADAALRSWAGVVVVVLEVVDFPQAAR